MSATVKQEESAAKCDFCEEYHRPTRLYKVEQEYWCRGCVRLAATLCKMCHAYYPNDRLVLVSSYGTVCEGCFQRDFGPCRNCNHFWPFWDFDNDGYCPNCTDGERGVIHAYEFDPPKKFYGSGPLFYGIELEVEKDGHIDIESIVGDEQYLYAKYDDSVRHGLEFVSHPASLDWIRADGMKRWWDHVFALRRKRYRSWNTSTCGMHIHMSAKAFSCLQLYKLLRFFSRNARFVARISGRTRKSLKRWASLDATDDYRITHKAKRKENPCRYVALNCTGETVECRIFRGSLNPKRFMANLEFMQAMYDFTRVSGLQDMTVEKFHGFVERNQKHYKAFWNLHKANFRVPSTRIANVDK